MGGALRVVLSQGEPELSAVGATAKHEGSARRY